MRIKLDENLPVELASRLNAFGHDVHTTQAQGLLGAEDSAIWEAAQREGRFLITQDLDFSDLRKFVPGSHHGLLLIRLRQPARRILIEKVEALFSQEPIEEWSRCFVVATAHKLRIRRPPD